MKADLRTNPDFDKTAAGRIAWTPGNVHRALKTKRKVLGVHFCLWGNETCASVRGSRPRPLHDAKVQRAIAQQLIAAGFEPPPKELGRRPLDLPELGGTL
jgi:hypothetical protein